MLMVGRGQFELALKWLDAIVTIYLSDDDPDEQRHLNCGIILYKLLPCVAVSARWIRENPERAGELLVKTMPTILKDLEILTKRVRQLRYLPLFPCLEAYSKVMVDVPAGS